MGWRRAAVQSGYATPPRPSAANQVGREPDDDRDQEMAGSPHRGEASARREPAGRAGADDHGGDQRREHGAGQMLEPGAQEGAGREPARQPEAAGAGGVGDCAHEHDGEQAGGGHRLSRQAPIRLPATAPRMMYQVPGQPPFGRDRDAAGDQPRQRVAAAAPEPGQQGHEEGGGEVVEAPVLDEEGQIAGGAAQHGGGHPEHVEAEPAPSR